jgi:hypothetical protein
MGIRATQSQVASELGIKRQAVHAHVKAGRLAIDGDGKIDLEVARTFFAGLNPAKSKASANLAAGHSTPPPVKAAPDSGPGAPASSSTSSPGAADEVTGITSFQVARTIAEKYRALNEKAEYLQRIGRLIDAEEVVKAVRHEHRVARDAMLSLAARLAPVVAAEPSAEKCHELIAAEVRRICEDLSADPTAPAGRLN